MVGKEAYALGLYGKSVYEQGKSIAASEIEPVYWFIKNWEGDDETLKDTIASMSVGETGYVWVLDYNGNYVVSNNRASDGKNIWNAEDNDGVAFVQEMIKKGKDLTANDVDYQIYPWKNEGETVPRDKISAFVHIPEREWIVGAGAYYDELIGDFYTELSDIVVGDTGFVFILDTSGNMVLHKKVQGENWADKEYVQHILSDISSESFDGVGYHRYISPETGTYKIAAYAPIEGTNHIIISSAFEEEFLDEFIAIQKSANEQINMMILLSIGLIVAGSIIAYLFVSKLVKPLSDLKETSDKFAKGDRSSTLNKKILAKKDEIGSLAKSFSSMLTQIKDKGKIDESFLHGIPDPAFKVNNDLVITDHNKAFREALGYTEKEINGKMTCGDVCKTPVCNTDNCTIKNCMKTKGTIVAETVATAKNGQKIPIRAACGCLLDSNNEPVGGFEIVQNLTVLKNLVDNVEKMSKGDLTITIDKNNFNENDSTSILGRSVAKMVDSYRHMVGKIRDSTDLVLETAEKLSANTEEVTASSEQASSSIQEISKGSQDLSSLSVNTTHSTNELLEKVKNMDEIANKTADATENVNKIAEKGGMAAADASEKMNNIREVVTKTSQTVKELGNKSEQIHKVVELINSISEQTNLLALNAAIEAARAGDAGRGFAVVADEVRKLAEESQNATKQIDSMIEDISSSTKNAVNSMSQSVKDVNDSGKIVNEALSSLDEITSNISLVTEQINEIKDSSDIQMKSAEEVQRSIENVSAVSQESAAGSEEISSSIEETTSAIEQIADMAQNLTDKADELKELMSIFKIPGAGNIKSNINEKTNNIDSKEK